MHKKRRAVALGYDPHRDTAPRVLAKGDGALADQILALAHKYQIPVRKDTLLVAALASVDIGKAIPPHFYRVVAEVFAYLYAIREQAHSRRLEESGSAESGSKACDQS